MGRAAGSDRLQRLACDDRHCLGQLRLELQRHQSRAVTIDDRTFNTNYNVLDNRNVAKEVWLRGGFELKLAPGLTLKSQAYGYGAERTWLNNEVEAFNANSNLVDRERFYVAHSQKLAGNITDLTWDAHIAGLENRLVRRSP